MDLSLAVAAIFALAQLCGGYKTGAPLFSCRTMTPGHGAAAQTELSPYTLSADPVGPPDAGRIRVNLVAPRGTFFLGYLIQARPLDSEDAIGSFIRIPTDSSLLNCGRFNASAITQRDNKRKRTVDVEWEAPDGFDGDVQFLATVVLNYTTFWVGQESDALQVIKRGAPNAPANAGSEDSQDLREWETQLYRGCGANKNCVGAPPNCLSSKSCTAIGTIQRQDDGTYLVEMLAKNSKYVAYGLSDDIKMGGDAVIECEGSDDGRVQAFRSWNVPNNKKNVRRPEDQTDFSLKRSFRADGAIACSLQHSPTISVLDSENFQQIQFDLDNREYYALLAAGSSLKAGTVGFHDVAFVSSPEKKVLADYRRVVKKDEIFNGCGETKNCFGVPQGCVELQSCSAVATFMVQGNKYLFEMKATNNAAYVAVGLSEDNKMGGDSVMECVHEGSASSNSIRAYTSYNLPGVKANERLGEDGITVLNSSYIDGTIYCKILRDKVTTVKGKIFDLGQDQYNVLLAAGSKLKQNSVGYHDLAVDATAQRKALSDVGAFTAGTKLFVRLHGAFMVSAWIGAASIGIVLARYYKQTWVGSRLCTKDQWFAWHRFLMFITWLLSISGGVLIFYDVGGWVSGPSETHALLGVITTSLAFIQPIGAYLRPHPESSKRWLFNWFHWLVGNAAHIIGIVTIFLAVELGKAELPNWVDWILVAYVAFYVLVHLILSVSGCMSEQQKQQRVNSFPMKDMHLSRSPSYIERKSDAPYSGFRKFILFFYVLAILVVTAVLVVIIVYAPIEKNWDSMKEIIMP